VVIDDKGEKLHKDSKEMTKRENFDIGKKYDKGRGSIKILNTQVGRVSS
jgi:hypothetical protein